MTGLPGDVAPLLRAEAVDEALGLAELAGGEVPVEVQTWLARLALLYGVPFEHLVPDATMLPVESIRFFHLDASWVEAMVDGAFSVGAHSERDVRFHRLLKPVVREATAAASGRFRDQVRGETGGGTASSYAGRSGLLMRSEIVSGWPGLEVTAYAGHDQDSDPVPVLRLDRLAPDLLLVVLADVPGLVVLAEPAEGLHFGIDATEDDRDLVAAGTGRVDVVGLASRRATARGMDPARGYGPADLAADLVDAAVQQHFVTGADR